MKSQMVQLLIELLSGHLFNRKTLQKNPFIITKLWLAFILYSKNNNNSKSNSSFLL